MRSQSRPALTKSTVVDMQTGKPMDSDVRTRCAGGDSKGGGLPGGLRAGGNTHMVVLRRSDLAVQQQMDATTTTTTITVTAAHNNKSSNRMLHIYIHIHTTPTPCKHQYNNNNTNTKQHNSKGTFYQRGHDAVIRRIEERVAAATMVPVENQEGLQILHYENGEKYGAFSRRGEGGGAFAGGRRG